MDDVDDQSVSGRAEGQRPSGHQQRDNVEEERQVTGH